MTTTKEFKEFLAGGGIHELSPVFIDNAVINYHLPEWTILHVNKLIPNILAPTSQVPIYHDKKNNLVVVDDKNYITICGSQGCGIVMLENTKTIELMMQDHTILVLREGVRALPDFLFRYGPLLISTNDYKHTQIAIFNDADTMRRMRILNTYLENNVIMPEFVCKIVEDVDAPIPNSKSPDDSETSDTKSGFSTYKDIYFTNGDLKFRPQGTIINSNKSFQRLFMQHISASKYITGYIRAYEAEKIYEDEYLSNLFYTKRPLMATSQKDFSVFDVQVTAENVPKVRERLTHKFSTNTAKFELYNYDVRYGYESSANYIRDNYDRMRVDLLELNKMFDERILEGPKKIN